MLTRSHRFHGLGALSFAHRQGQTARAPQLLLKYASNNRHQTYRVAVVVSKKVSKSAVVRNRIRRRIFEAARAELGAKAPALDLIFMVHTEQLATMPAAELQKTVAKLLRQAGAVI